MIHVLLVLLALAVPAAAAETPPTSDEAAIRQTALDYIEGWYEGDAERMKRAVHPDLAKRIVVTDPRTDRSELTHTSATKLVDDTAAGYGTRIPADLRDRQVEILDVYENAASVKIVAARWIDYLHLARVDGEWKIVNVLWELRPDRKPEAKEGSEGGR